MNRPTERLNGRPRYLAPLLLCLLVPGVLALGACKKGEGAGPEGPEGPKDNERDEQHKRAHGAIPKSGLTNCRS